MVSERKMKNRKLWILATAAILLTVVCGPVSFGQDTSGSKQEVQQKIGFVSLETIESQWLEYMQLRNDMEKLFLIDKRDIQNLQESVIKREKKLQEQRDQGQMTEEQYNNWHNQLMLESQEIAIYAKVRSRLVKSKVDKRLDKASKIVQEKIEEVGKEEGYDLIISEDDVMGYDTGMDISQMVVKKLNSQDLGI